MVVENDLSQVKQSFSNSVLGLLGPINRVRGRPFGLFPEIGNPNKSLMF
jgi:hypothetical protein